MARTRFSRHRTIVECGVWKKLHLSRVRWAVAKVAFFVAFSQRALLDMGRNLRNRAQASRAKSGASLDGEHGCGSFTEEKGARSF